MKLDFISIRIASKGYTIYKMSPMTATRIMTAIDVKKEPDESKACIAAMAYSVALAIVRSRSIFHRLRAWLLCRRFMKRSTFAELFDCYQKTLLMIPLEDIASVAAVMEGLATTISKDHD